MFEGRVVLSYTCHSRRATANGFSAVEIQGFFFSLLLCLQLYWFEIESPDIFCFCLYAGESIQRTQQEREKQSPL